MADWVDVVPVEALPPGTCHGVDLDGVAVVVVNVDGCFHAIEDLCTHDGGRLSGGEVRGCEIVCPRHGARFSLLTGAALSPPAYEAVATFPLRVEAGMVQVRDERWD